MGYFDIDLADTNLEVPVSRPEELMTCVLPKEISDVIHTWFPFSFKETDRITQPVCRVLRTAKQEGEKDSRDAYDITYRVWIDSRSFLNLHVSGVGITRGLMRRTSYCSSAACFEEMSSGAR